VKPAQIRAVKSPMPMNTPICFRGLRRAALASLVLISAGALSAEEKAPEKAAPAKSDVPPSVLKKFDRNKDGVLDEKELAKWEADKAAKREKYAKERAEMLEKFDANKDGKISEEERAAAKLEMGKARTEADAAKAKEKDAKWKAEQEALKQAEAEKAAVEAAAKAGAEGGKPPEGKMDDATTGDQMMMQ
jgi:hypothetical protein